MINKDSASIRNMAHGANRQNLAELFIPDKDDGINSLNWRIALVHREDLYPSNKMIENLRAAKNKELTEGRRKALVELARSENIVLDELETTTLIVTKWLLEADTMSLKRLLFIHRQSRVFVALTGEKNVDEYFKGTRGRLKNYGEQLLRREVMRIRAKLALQELVAMMAPDELIPDLIAISPKYFESRLTQRWIKIQQIYSRSDDKPKREAASINLKRLIKSIDGDKRSARKRRYPYWRIGMHYEDLLGNIKGFRRLRAEGAFDKEYFEMFCQRYEIPPHYPDLMLDPRKAAGQLAIDILVAKGLINDARSFEEFRPFINNIQKKHFKGGILSVANDILPVISDFLDLPRTHPEIVLALDPMSVLEQVPIAFPRPNS